jgi:anti-sigma regulatory factor (Ser/Thr protein kinase)
MSEARNPWKRLTLEFESRLDAVALPGEVVHLLCSAAGFSPIEGAQVELCVAEAINNSIKHAYREDPLGKIELEISLMQDQLVVDVWDWGISATAADIHLDHRHALEVRPDLIQEISESGRGLAIIQEVMDLLEYTPGPAGNRLRMIKRRQMVWSGPTSAPLG